jgi:hypothetical protein
MVRDIRKKTMETNSLVDGNRILCNRESTLLLLMDLKERASLMKMEKSMESALLHMLMAKESKKYGIMVFYKHLKKIALSFDQV